MEWKSGVAFRGVRCLPSLLVWREDSTHCHFYISYIQTSGFWSPWTGCVTLGWELPLSKPCASRRPRMRQMTLHLVGGAPLLACRIIAALWPLELVKIQDRCLDWAH